jgi:hypothetical protein
MGSGQTSGRTRREDAAFYDVRLGLYLNGFSTNLHPPAEA